MYGVHIVGEIFASFGSSKTPG